MSQPSVPVFLIEGPASACVIGGEALGWKNCTCLSFAMGIFKSTLGRVTLSGCAIRSTTGDTINGTTIEQNAKVAEAHGVHVEIHTGPGVCTPGYGALQLQTGRGLSLAGNTQPDGRGNVNHNVWVNHVRGGTLGHPTEAYVYDPWSKGPTWWSWTKVLAFAAALHPWGEQDDRHLGPGKWYCGIFPDTEPHAHLHYGAVHTAPFPDKVVVKSPAAGRKVNVRTRPDRLVSIDVVQTLASGTPWIAFQKTTGARPPGSTSRIWYGNHDGNRWIHDSGLIGEGGTS